VAFFEIVPLNERCSARFFFSSAFDHDFISKDEKKVQVSGFAVNILHLLVQKFTPCIQLRFTYKSWEMVLKNQGKNY
jgi:hypothetical protein